jgi:hypothetical protein
VYPALTNPTKASPGPVNISDQTSFVGEIFPVFALITAGLAAGEGLACLSKQLLGPKKQRVFGFLNHFTVLLLLPSPVFLCIAFLFSFPLLWSLLGVVFVSIGTGWLGWMARPGAQEEVQTKIKEKFGTFVGRLSKPIATAFWGSFALFWYARPHPGAFFWDALGMLGLAHCVLIQGRHWMGTLQEGGLKDPLSQVWTPPTPSAHTRKSLSPDGADDLRAIGKELAQTKVFLFLLPLSYALCCLFGLPLPAQIFLSLPVIAGLYLLWRKAEAGILQAQSKLQEKFSSSFLVCTGKLPIPGGWKLTFFSSCCSLALAQRTHQELALAFAVLGALVTCIPARSTWKGFGRLKEAWKKGKKAPVTVAQTSPPALQGLGVFLSVLQKALPENPPHPSLKNPPPAPPAKLWTRKNPKLPGRNPQA